MARTGTQFAKLTGDYSSINVYATWQLRKQDASTGESTIRLREYLTYSSNGTYGSSYSTFKLQNKTVKSGSYEYTGSGDYLLGYTDIVVKHNADGSFPNTTLKAYAYSYHFANKPSKTATLTNKDIPNIQMISTIADISGSKELLEHTDSSSSVLISSNLLDNYVSTLSAVVDNIEYTILENITFSNLVVCFDQMVYEGMAGSDKPHIYIQDLDWKNLCNKIPNAKSIDITFRLTTFEDNTYSVELGQSDKVYTFEVNKADIDFEPFLKADNNTIALTGNDETFIQLISPFIMDSNVKALNNGATISEYGYGFQISYEDNQSYSTQYYRTEPTFAYEPINASNVKTLRLYVSLIDSRGYTLISPSIFVPSEEYTLLRYVKPILENITIERPEQTAPYVHMNISGSFWKNNFGNVQNNLQLQYRYILNTDTQYTEWLNLTPVINDDGTFNFNGNVGTVQNPIVPTENSATFEIRAIDSTGFEVKEINFTIPKGKSMFDWAENYFSWNGELCIDDNEVPCFQEDSVEDDGSRNITLYDSQGKKLNVAPSVEGGIVKMILPVDLANISTSYNYFHPFSYSDNVVTVEGNKLTYDSKEVDYGDRTGGTVYGVTVGSGVEYVRVSYNIRVLNNHTSNLIYTTDIGLVRNGELTVYGGTSDTLMPSTRHTTTAEVTQIPVKEGDFLFIYAYKGNKSADLDVISAWDMTNATFEVTHITGVTVINNIGGGSSSGTSNYNELENLPRINGIKVTGNKTSADYGIQTLEAGDNIEIVDNKISVLTTDEAQEDNTKPMTSSGVYTQLGNIAILLETI